ncbi:hypothetical protein [Nonomuraea sp. NPDC049129]|uniref:hypothetical protein n=1 Tax=Nonomuraea sp. NPDC049129 TaxID=3155272 RepID=UPI0033D2F0F1
MLGVPYADHEFFQKHTVKMFKQSTPPEERWAAMGAIQGYMADLIAEKEENPPDDLLGRQIVKLRADGTYRRTALTGMGVLLLLALLLDARGVVAEVKFGGQHDEGMQSWQGKFEAAHTSTDINSSTSAYWTYHPWSS